MEMKGDVCLHAAARDNLHAGQPGSKINRAMHMHARLRTMAMLRSLDPYGALQYERLCVCMLACMRAKTDHYSSINLQPCVLERICFALMRKMYLSRKEQAQV